MTEVSFEVKLPPDLLQFGYDQARIQRNAKEWLVLSLFTGGLISSGKASSLLNISRVAFLSLLKKRGIAYLDCSPQELREEFEAVKELDMGARE